jgi:hypothetical protein
MARRFLKLSSTRADVFRVLVAHGFRGLCDPIGEQGVNHKMPHSGSGQDGGLNPHFQGAAFVTESDIFVDIRLLLCYEHATLLIRGTHS